MPEFETWAEVGEYLENMAQRCGILEWLGWDAWIEVEYNPIRLTLHVKKREEPLKTFKTYDISFKESKQ